MHRKWLCCAVVLSGNTPLLTISFSNFEVHIRNLEKKEQKIAALQKKIKAVWLSLRHGFEVSSNQSNRSMAALNFALEI